MGFQRVILSPVDQLMPTSYIRLFLVVRTGQASFDTAVEHLRHGLKRTQRQLPYIGGAIFETTSGRIGIEWEDGGHPPEIQIRSKPRNFLSSTELELTEHPFGEVWQLGGPSDRFGGVEIRDGLPAITITCSQLDRYLVLGVSCFHSLWDIAGLSVFLHLWSRNTKNPSDDVILSIVEDISHRNDRLRRSLGTNNPRGSTSFNVNLEALCDGGKANIDTCTLQLDVAKMKVLCHHLYSESGKSISVNDLAVAIIWTCVTLDRVSSDRRSLGPPRLRVLVDGRKHVFKPMELKTPYMGNLALPLFSGFNHDQALDNVQVREFNSVLITAVNAMLSSSQQASPASFVEAISVVDEVSSVSTVRESSAVYNAQQLTSTSWSQAPMYVDFGARVGKVEHVRIAPDDYRLEGMILTLPRKRDGSDGSHFLEIFLALHMDELRRLRKHNVIQSLAFVRPKSNENHVARAKI